MQRLPRKDAVIVGLGWTGAIMGYELCQAGLDVVALERGPWRDTSTDFNIGTANGTPRIAAPAAIPTASTAATTICVRA